MAPIHIPLPKKSISQLPINPQGIHAQYNVYLSQKTQIPHSEAFLIVPNNGYQKQSFDINVIDTTLIDYENLDWQTFNIDVSILLLSMDFFFRSDLMLRWWINENFRKLVDSVDKLFICNFALKLCYFGKTACGFLQFDFRTFQLLNHFNISVKIAKPFPQLRFNTSHYSFKRTAHLTFCHKKRRKQEK